MKNALVLTLSMFMLANLFGQANQPKYIAEALKAYESGKYFEAMPKLEAAYNKMTNKGKSISEKGSMAYKLADCYRRMEQYDKAALWYGSSIELKYYDIEPKVYYYHGEMLRMNGELAKAKDSYNNYKNKRGKDISIDIDALISTCSEYNIVHDEKSNYEVKVEEKLNAKEFDMSPSLYDKKETQFYFGTQRDDIANPARDPITGEKFMDIWVAEYNEKGDFVSAKTIDAENLINTKDNEGTAVLDRKGKTLYFTRCPALPKQNLGCDIWSADKVGENEWDNVVKININKQGDSSSVGHPCITADGMMLIFASNMPGGLGGKDLWYITYNKKNQMWDTVPKNMGPGINTAGNELFPSTSYNDSLFFFASDGHPGIGGLDIFKATITTGIKEPVKKWGNVQNMLKPINSASNDYAISIRKDLKSGFFTSERSNPKNRTYTPDIYSFSTPPVSFELTVIVSELGSKKAIEGAKVTVNEINGASWDGVTKKGGKTDKWAERKGDKKNPRYINNGFNYDIKASKERYLPMIRASRVTTIDSLGKPLEQSKSFVVKIELIPIELRTPEIRYHLDQWTFVNDSTPKDKKDWCISRDSLKFLVKLLKDNPEIMIELYSHTDSRDTKLHNEKLSENRAIAVYQELVKADPNNACRVTPIGRGESESAKYIDDKGVEQTLTEDYINLFKADKVKFEALHQLNRRTTVKIIMEPGTENPKLYDSSVPCDKNIDTYKYTVPLPR
jgi:outer membrane protein OmpA-like peptidoglycan-associated protein/tetratricopeptide (TPR) repeat protein